MSEGKVNVLFIDNQPEVLILFELIAKPLIYVAEVFKARNSNEALEILRGNHIDLAIVDLKLDDFDVLDGRELARQMVRKEPKLKFLICSGFDEELIGVVEIDGYIGYLEKPFRKEVLEGHIENILSEAA